MRNAEATRERILEAATAEFSAFGIAGARVDRIARTSGCNKNLIYVYFESKEALFTTVLRKQIARSYENIAFTPEDLPGYAMQMFDFVIANPDFVRLMAWFALEQRAENPAERNAARDSKLAALLGAQNAGRIASTFPPAFLMISIMSLASAWTAANPFGLPLHPDALNHPEDVRKNIAEAVRLLTEAKQDAATGRRSFQHLDRML